MLKILQLNYREFELEHHLDKRCCDHAVLYSKDSKANKDDLGILEQPALQITTLRTLKSKHYKKENFNNKENVFVFVY